MAELLFPLQFKRQYSGPLDPDMVFDTTAEMNTYLTSPLRYAGQVVSCLDQEGSLFILNNALDTWNTVSGGGDAFFEDVPTTSDIRALNTKIIRHNDLTNIKSSDETLLNAVNFLGLADDTVKARIALLGSSYVGTNLLNAKSLIVQNLINDTGAYLKLVTSNAQADVVIAPNGTEHFRFRSNALFALQCTSEGSPGITPTDRGDITNKTHMGIFASTDGSMYALGVQPWAETPVPPNNWPITKYILNAFQINTTSSRIVREYRNAGVYNPTGGPIAAVNGGIFIDNTHRTAVDNTFSGIHFRVQTLGSDAVTIFNTTASIDLIKPSKDTTNGVITIKMRRASGSTARIVSFDSIGYLELYDISEESITPVNAAQIYSKLGEMYVKNATGEEIKIQSPDGASKWIDVGLTSIKTFGDKSIIVRKNITIESDELADTESVLEFKNSNSVIIGTLKTLGTTTTPGYQPNSLLLKNNSSEVNANTYIGSSFNGAVIIESGSQESANSFAFDRGNLFLKNTTSHTGNTDRFNDKNYGQIRYESSSGCLYAYWFANSDSTGRTSSLLNFWSTGGVSTLKPREKLFVQGELKSSTAYNPNAAQQNGSLTLLNNARTDTDNLFSTMVFRTDSLDGSGVSRIGACQTGAVKHFKDRNDTSFFVKVSRGDINTNRVVFEHSLFRFDGSLRINNTVQTIDGIANTSGLYSNNGKLSVINADGNKFAINSSKMCYFYARNAAVSAFNEIWAGLTSDSSLSQIGWMIPYAGTIKKVTVKMDGGSSACKIRLFKNLAGNTEIVSGTTASAESTNSGGGTDTAVIFDFGVGLAVAAGDTMRMSITDWCNYPSATLIIEE